MFVIVGIATAVLLSFMIVIIIIMEILNRERMNENVEEKNDILESKQWQNQLNS